MPMTVNWVNLLRPALFFWPAHDSMRSAATRLRLANSRVDMEGRRPDDLRGLDRKEEAGPEVNQCGYCQRL
jgi:hypothetical protein